mgnify:CR=1 FL=1
MIASHLSLIVGSANAKPELYSLIEQYEDWSGSQNLVWITNRQQGKTTTLSKFTGIALIHPAESSASSPSSACPFRPNPQTSDTPQPLSPT